MSGTPESWSARGGTPLSATEIACRAAQALTASGASRGGLKAGALAPGFTLNDCEGRAVSLSVALTAGPAVVTFHGGLWCPTCTADLHALQAALPEYTRLGATLLAISPQTPSHNRAARDEAGISFPMLADPRNRVASAFGVLVKLTSDLIDLYQKSGIDLPTLNGDESWALPLPARFVIASDRTIRYAEVSADFTRRPDPLELLPVLRSATRSA
jgi:peroxiredoxin